MPQRIHLEGADANALARQAVERLQAPCKPLRVMITRAVEADGLMKRVLEAHGIRLQGLELLVPHAIPFALQGSFDRMFFTSRNAVRFFVQGGGDLHAASCDAIGSGTAEELRKHGVEAGFVGDGPDTPSIASHYVARFGPQRVLFPCAEKGLRTVQRAMQPQHAIDLPVYRMLRAVPRSVPEAQIAIVTSPDHAEALHAVTPLKDITHLIAMGTSTAARIKELGGTDVIVPWASSEMALIDAVFGIATAP